MKLPNCDVCRKRVAAGTGYVCVDNTYALFMYPKLHEEWKQRANSQRGHKGLPRWY